MKKAVEIILILVIIGTAIAFGGVEPLAYSLMELGILVAVLLLLLKGTREHRIMLRPPIWPLLFIFLVILQLVPLPVSLVEILSPMRLDPRLFGTHGASAWASLTIYRHKTIVELLKFITYFAAFLLACYIFDSRKRRSLLVSGLVLLGVSEAGYGIVQYATGWHKIFNFVNRFGLEEATGTYINRNHFVGLLELTLPFSLAFVYYYYQLRLERGRYRRSQSLGNRASSAGTRAIFFLNVAMVMFVAAVFSRSRGGIMAAILGTLFVAMLAQIKTRRKTWALGVVAFLAVVFGYAIWIGLNPVLARFETVQSPGAITMGGRIEIWKDVLRQIHDFPLTGTGLGTFPIAYQHYQTTAIGLMVPHAHNDYLEFLSGTGPLGAALVFLPIFWLLAKMIIAFLDDPHLYRRTIILGCIGSTVMILIHSFVDFNLEIPANALIFAVILGIGYKAACVERRAAKAASEPAVALAADRDWGN